MNLIPVNTISSFYSALSYIFEFVKSIFVAALIGIGVVLSILAGIGPVLSQRYL